MHICTCKYIILILKFVADIEAQIEEIQAKRKAAGDRAGKVSAGEKVFLLSSDPHFDTDVYTSLDKSRYVTSIPANEEEDVAESRFDADMYSSSLDKSRYATSIPVPEEENVSLLVFFMMWESKTAKFGVGSNLIYSPRASISRVAKISLCRSIPSNM